MDGKGQHKGGSGRQFQFVRCLGVGGFGEVYLAEMSTSSGFTKMVAVKLLKDNLEANPNVAERMRDEARLLGMLRHRTIIRADDLISLSGRIAVIMEYVPGCNLTTAIDPARNTEVFPIRTILSVVQNVANALDVAFHRPSPVSGKPLEVLHRDIKPGNIRLTPDGEVKVLDFGIARSDNFDREASTTEYQLGSLNYMAPELLIGSQASPASDVYSLGVTFFECIARDRYGWAGECDEMHMGKLKKRLAELDLSSAGDVQQEVVELLLQMMEFDPAARPSPAEVMKRARQLYERCPGDAIEDWAPETVMRLKKIEETDEDENGDLTGRTLFEELSTASFKDQSSMPMFHDDSTLALPGGTPDVVEETKRLRWMETLILLLLLGGAGFVWYSFDSIQAEDRQADKPVLSARPKAKPAPPKAESPAEVAVVKAEAAPAEADKKKDKDEDREDDGPPVAVRIASMPMGLAVIVDGKPRGSTPLSGLMLTPGKHKLVIKDGAKKIKKTIRVKAKGKNLWKYIAAQGKIK